MTLEVKSRNTSPWFDRCDCRFLWRSLSRNVMVWSVLRLNLYHPITLCRQKKIHHYCWITVCDCHTEASLVQCKVMSELFANRYVFKQLINLKPLKLLSLIPIFFPSKPCVELACFWACVQAETANFLLFCCLFLFSFYFPLVKLCSVEKT